MYDKYNGFNEFIDNEIDRENLLKFIVGSKKDIIVED